MGSGVGWGDSSLPLTHSSVLLETFYPPSGRKRHSSREFKGFLLLKKKFFLGGGVIQNLVVKGKENASPV